MSRLLQRWLWKRQWILSNYSVLNLLIKIFVFVGASSRAKTSSFVFSIQPAVTSPTGSRAWVNGKPINLHFSFTMILATNDAFSCCIAPCHLTTASKTRKKASALRGSCDCIGATFSTQRNGRPLSYCFPWKHDPILPGQQSLPCPVCLGRWI